MIKQERNYIYKQKKKYGLYSIIWTMIVFGVFGTGVILTKTRANLFTVSACLLAIVAALFITRYISFSRYHDVNAEGAQILEEMKGNYNLYHNVVIPYSKGTAYFEHVLITNRMIYFIAYTDQQLNQHRTWVQELMGMKGIGTSHLSFLVAKDLQQLKNHKSRIEKETKGIKEECSHLEEYSKKMDEILM